jgi:type IV pilus assembly protein PilN
LANIKQEGEILTLEGRAQSNARVSNYMRNLESSGWMTNPDLSIIEAKAEEKVAGAPVVTSEARQLPYAFTLKVKLANPNAPDAEGNVTAPAATAANTPAVSAPAQVPLSASPAPVNAPAAPAASPAPPPAAAPATTAPSPSNTPVEKPAPMNQGRPAS